MKRKQKSEKDQIDLIFGFQVVDRKKIGQKSTTSE